MKKQIKIELLKNSLNKKFFCIKLYNKFIYNQYIVEDDLIYTFFLIINFLHKYGFVKIK